MKNKIISLLLVLILVFSSLVACVPTPTPEVPDGPCSAHADVDDDGKCDKCGEVVEDNTPPSDSSGDDDGYNFVAVETPEASWSDEVKLVYQLTLNSNYNQMTSGCGAYMNPKDEEYDAESEFSRKIKARNDAAKSYLKLDIEYRYFPNSTGYGVMQNLTRIITLARSKSELDRPDIFCNFVYDMMAASLNSSFKNLYSDTHSSVGLGAGALANYFPFAKEGKYDPSYVDTGAGYMVDYMRSLSLSDNQIFLLASDYIIDLQRAFYVVPVNIQLIESIDVSKTVNPYITDRDKADGKYTIDEFYAMVKSGKWTYDTVAAFAQDVYQSDGGTDILDGTIGFAINNHSEKVAMALTYTNPINIIQHQYRNQQHSYWYPSTDEEPVNELASIYTGISELFSAKNPGVVTVGSDMTVNQSSYAANPSNAIRLRFAENKVLFGDIVCLGELEGREYKDMVKELGTLFGVAPVPIYGVATGNSQGYHTAIDRVGKVAAISYESTKFAYASAYLNYMSLNSADVLDGYYDELLFEHKARGFDTASTKDMITFMRRKVASSQYQMVSDVMFGIDRNNPDRTFNSNKIHNFIITHRYNMKATEFLARYEDVFEVLDSYLEKMEGKFENIYW